MNDPRTIGHLTKNSVICGDCLEVMSKMQNDSVDCTITSPPYNLNKGSKLDEYFASRKTYDTIDDGMPIEQYFSWVDKVIMECYRVTKNHVFFNIQEVQGNKGIIQHILSNHSEIIKETMIWAKTNGPPQIQPKVVSRCFEYIFCFSKDDPSKVTFTKCNFEREYVQNVLFLPIGNEVSGCFAFPNELPEHFIKWFSKENEIIFDPFSGSGTTCYMAKKMGRQYIGIDISPDKVEMTKARLTKIPNHDLFHFDQTVNA